jgi:HAD superfamily phosphatase (TIGR01668 family)
MKITFIPEYYFEAFHEASAEFLLSIGVKGIVLDVDNTLEPYENPTPGEHVVRWLESLRAAGISAAIVSNNGGERINLFNKSLGLPAYYKANKPFKKNVLNAMNDMGTVKENTVLMGDQVFTDVWAAHNAGIRAILVPPIKDKTDLLTKFKRLLEKLVLKRIKNAISSDNTKQKTKE